MNILLINANRFKQPWPVIPFGLVCVASALERAGHAVRVLDLCFAKNCERSIRNALREFRPGLIGASIRNIDNSAGYRTQFLLEHTRVEVFEPLKRLYDGPIVIGGPAVGINAPEILAYLDVPYAIRGDGEHAMLQFAATLEAGLPFDEVGGLVQRRNGVLLVDNPPTPVPDLNEFPTPNPGRYLDLAPYRQFNSPLQIQTKRGCALNCSYCVYNKIEGVRYRLRDPERVADDLARLSRETGLRNVEFTDSTFNAPLSHAKAVLRAIVARGLRLELRTMGLHPKYVDEELVGLMKEAGFTEVDLGAESACDATLEGLGKNYTAREVVRAGALLRARKIPVTWYLLLGGPNETAETLRETFDTVNRAADPWDLINIGVGLRVYNGALVADELRRRNPACTSDNFLTPVHYEPAALSLDEVKRIVKTEALRRPNFFMYDEDEDMPAFAVRCGMTLLRILKIRHPFFRLYILMRKTQAWLGIARLKQMAYASRRKPTVQGERLRIIMETDSA